MDAEGWIDLAAIATFNRVKNLTSDVALIEESLKSSQIVELVPSSSPSPQVNGKIRKLNDWQKWLFPETMKPSLCEYYGIRPVSPIEINAEDAQVEEDRVTEASEPAEQDEIKKEPENGEVDKKEEEEVEVEVEAKKVDADDAVKTSEEQEKPATLRVETEAKKKVEPPVVVEEEWIEVTSRKKKNPPAMKKGKGRAPASSSSSFGKKNNNAASSNASAAGAKSGVNNVIAMPSFAYVKNAQKLLSVISFGEEFDENSLTSNDDDESNSLTVVTTAAANDSDMDDDDIDQIVIVTPKSGKGGFKHFKHPNAYDRHQNDEMVKEAIEDGLYMYEKDVLRGRRGSLVEQPQQIHIECLDEEAFQKLLSPGTPMTPASSQRKGRFYPTSKHGDESGVGWVLGY